MQIKTISTPDLENYINHLTRHFKEYGVGGIISHPFPVDEPGTVQIFVRNYPSAGQKK